MELMTEPNPFRSGSSWVQVQVEVKGRAVWDAFASVKVLVKIEIPHTTLYDLHCPASLPDTNLDPKEVQLKYPCFQKNVLTLLAE